MATEYDVLLQENQVLRREHAQMRLELSRRQQPRQSAGCASTLAWLAVIAAFVFVALAAGPDILVSYGVVSPETMAGVLHFSTPAPDQKRTPPPTYPPSSGNSGSPARVLGAPLPSCSTVTDTRTACEQDTNEPTPTVEPLPTSAPLYETDCQTAPGERPCWLPTDQPWQSPASVPETPIVLVPAATDTPLIFAGAACANWRPPLKMPEGCGSE